LYVDDLADACIHLMKNYSEELHVNIGSGKDLEILELANIIRDVVGYEGAIEHDLSKPDGTMRKLLDVSLLESTGWKYKTELKVGIEKIYTWFKESVC